MKGAVKKYIYIYNHILNNIVKNPIYINKNVVNNEFYDIRGGSGMG